ncbi:MAG TPA: HD domain-containing phosphohydrolase [Candidatus Elarobacter sp.]|nr:HD domain-containing phosphohydrolase [Candidatus Elarobacter sp.]
MLSDLFAQPFTVAFLGAVLAHDYDTHRHLLNVGILSARVGAVAGLSPPDVVRLGQAGLFHDVGKLHVRRSLLNATHSLSENEWRLLREHAERGATMLLDRGARGVAALVRGHHERLDGSGYPDGVRGVAIPWETRLLSVVDAYDCMRSGRPYAAPIAHDEAVARLDAARRLYDPDAVAALVAALEGERTAARGTRGTPLNW